MGIETEPICGKYQLVSNDNSDNFLKELGCGYIFRKMANIFTPTIEINRDDETYVIRAQTWAKTLESRFKLGQEFDEDRFDGQKCRSVITANGNIFTQLQRDLANNMEVQYIREFGKNGELKVTSIANQVKCFRVYQRLVE